MTMNGKSLALSVRVRGPERYNEDEEAEEETSNSDTQKKRKLQVISTSPFTLPDDWIVEEKPRPYTSGRSKHVDKYYYEPGTRRKFRSLISVQRYLCGEERGAFSTEGVKSENENAMQIVPRTRVTTFFKLPDDWIMVETPRTNINYAGRIDRSYIEAGTGQRFRSLRTVERYLAEENAITATTKSLLKSGRGKKRATGKNCSRKASSKCPAVAEEDRVTPKAIKLATQSKKSGSQNKINLREDSKTLMPECSSPPDKVNWVLSGSGGMWSPFLNNCGVPESVKLKWSEAFILSINAGDRVASNC